MSRLDRWAKSSLAVQTGAVDGVLTFEFAGLLTAASMIAFFTDGMDLSQFGCTYVICAKFSRAAVAMSADELTALLFLPSVRDGLAIPAAVVCGPADAQVFGAHSLQAASRGFVRRVFTETAPAAAWCREKAGAARLAQLARMGAFPGL